MNTMQDVSLFRPGQQPDSFSGGRPRRWWQYALQAVTIILVVLLATRALAAPQDQPANADPAPASLDAFEESDEEMELFELEVPVVVTASR